jgi:hypothetical protein
VKALLRRMLGAVLGDYRINWIYAIDRPAHVPSSEGYDIRPVDDTMHPAIALSSTGKLANTLSYARAGMAGLALMREEKPLCVVHFARPDQYARSDTWPLRPGQMALMDIATEESARGQGLAPCLIAASARHFLEHDAQRLIAFIWWSNTPSVRAFTKAGWRRIGLSIEICLAGHWLALHIPLPS